MFATDLDRRGIEFSVPADPFTDPEWSKSLVGAYLSRAFAD